MSARPPRLVEHDPLVDAAPPKRWRDWGRFLLATSGDRVTAAALVLLAGIVSGAGALWFFGNLASEVMEGDTQRFDDGVLAFLRQFASPALTQAARVVSMMGSEVVAALLVILVVWFAWKRRWGAAASLLIVTGGAQLLNDVLKSHFHRTRPAPITTGLLPSQAWSFPSGHAMVSAAFYLFLAYLSWRILHGRARTLATAAFLLLILLIGLSRLYLGAHYFTDVLAGYVVGAVWTESVIIAGSLLAVHRRGTVHLPSFEPAQNRVRRRPV